MVTGGYTSVSGTWSDYPHGQYNNIYSNAGYVNSNEGSIGDLEIAYVNLGDNWEYNYFGGSVDARAFGMYGDRIVGLLGLWASFFERVPWTTPPPGIRKNGAMAQCGYAEHLGSLIDNLEAKQCRPIENAL